MKTVERDNVKIAYKVSGNGDTTLLFVHGSFIDMDYWSAQVEFFKQMYQVVTIDLPGHGKSGKNSARWTIQEYGAVVCTLFCNPTCSDPAIRFWCHFFSSLPEYV